MSPVAAMPTERTAAPRPDRAPRDATSSIVQGNGERASATVPCRESIRANERLDQWFRWPGVLPSEPQ